MSLWCDISLILHPILSKVQKYDLCNICLNGLPQPHFCACPKPRSGFLTSYVVVFLMFNDLRLEVIVCFVDIGGIVYRHCLNFLFIIVSLSKETSKIKPNGNKTPTTVTVKLKKKTLKVFLVLLKKCL